MIGIWERSAFVVTPGNVNLELAKRYVDKLCVQVAWGTSPIVVDERWCDKARSMGFQLYAWAWCDGKDVEGEAKLHAFCALTYDAFCANMEEPYDAHGDANSPKMGMPSAYLAALTWNGPLAVTTTPRFASHLGEWAKRGAYYQPQAFPLETKVGLTETVTFARDVLGYPNHLIRPLIQAYATNGQRPDSFEFNKEAESLGVGGIPYTLEQCLDPEGQAWLQGMRPTIERPQPPINLKPNGGNVGQMPPEAIGSQHGITAMCNLFRKQWPENHEAIKKFERTLNMLREDHDRRAQV
jgi:hypothetical protein